MAEGIGPAFRATQGLSCATLSTPTMKVMNRWLENLHWQQRMLKANAFEDICPLRIVKLLCGISPPGAASAMFVGAFQG